MNNPRPATPERKRQAAFRLPESILDRLDEMAVSLSRERGIPVTRAQVVRYLLVYGLDGFDRGEVL